MKKRLVILGGGESGTGTALLGLHHGYDVFVSDKGMIKQEYVDEMEANGIAYEQGQHTEALILNADIVVKSPGIPEKVAIVQSLMAKGICISIQHGKDHLYHRIKRKNNYHLAHLPHFAERWSKSRIGWKRRKEFCETVDW
jgi:UDP-N-acetylmuramoylalanine-D-glutamate ligase